MMAPVVVLHLPDPRELAVDRLGSERAEELFAIGAATPIEEVVAEILAIPTPSDGSVVPTSGMAGATP